MKADIEALADEAKSKTTRVVEKLQTVYVDPPRFSLMTGLIFFVIWAVLTFGYGWWKAHERDKWWRAEIASKSVKVKSAIAKANAELPDDEILSALEATDDALRDAENRLKERVAPTDACPLIRAECLRKR